MRQLELIPARSEVAQLLTAYSCQKLPWKQMVKQLGSVDDFTLEDVVIWLLEWFDPDFSKPDFDRDNPPFRIRRQLALFRRFLLSAEPYRWPAHAWGTNSGCLRLVVTGVACSVSIFAVPLAAFDSRAAAVAAFSIAFAAWMLIRERRASEQDWLRAQAHARQFGDPEVWPFLTANDFRRAGPSRMLWNRQL
jgi:hypothetical protein